VWRKDVKTPWEGNQANNSHSTPSTSKQGMTWTVPGKESGLKLEGTAVQHGISIWSRGLGVPSSCTVAPVVMAGQGPNGPIHFLGINWIPRLMSRFLCLIFYLGPLSWKPPLNWDNTNTFQLWGWKGSYRNDGVSLTHKSYLGITYIIHI
jgi:hypothetical protein